MSSVVSDSFEPMIRFKSYGQKNMKLIILPKIDNFTKIGNVIRTLEPETPKTQWKAQKTWILA